MRRTVMTGLSLACAVLVIAGCASRSATGAGSSDSSGGSTMATSSESTTSASTAAAGLSGSFTAVSVLGHKIVPGSTITISFQGGKIAVHAGCNSIGGQFTVEGGQLRVGDLSQTAMGCDQALMTQDSWLAAFLGASPFVQESGDSLILSGHGVVAESIELRPAVAEPTRPLEGTSWLLTTIVNGDTASSVPNGVEPTIAIAGDRITIDAQCNGIAGKVAVGDGTLTVSEVISTMMACDDARTEMEKLLKAVLTGTVPYSISGTQLTITGADGTQLIFTPAPATARADTTTMPDLGTDVLAPPEKSPSQTPDVPIPSVPEPTG